MSEDSFSNSSWIRGAKYNTKTYVMQIYVGEETFECENVDNDTWNEFKASKSKGKYFNSFIRGKFGSSSI